MQHSLKAIEERGVSVYKDEREIQQVRLLADILRTLNEIKDALAYPPYHVTVESETYV